MAGNQTPSGLFFGVLNANGASSASTFQLSTAANWLAFSYVAPASKTINALRFFCSAVAGTLTQIEADVFSDNAGVGPNASLASSTTVTGGVPTVAGWVEFTGFTLAVTAGTQYWFVLKNNTATPATNNLTYRYGTTGVWAGSYGFSPATWGSNGTRTTTNSGTAWSASSTWGTFGYRVAYSDGTYDGLPVSNMGTLAAANSAFGKQGVGVKLVLPAGPIYNIRGVQLALTKTGTPGNLLLKLYNGATLVDTATVPVGNVAGNRTYTGVFGATHPIGGGATVRIVACDATTSDTSSNNYSLQNYNIDSDSNSTPLIPFDGTGALTTTTDYTQSTPTFTDDQTQLAPFALIMDTTGEFAASGGPPAPMIVHLPSGIPDW
jgi:hypothetical protein